MEVTFGTGMSRISSVSRGEDNGSDNEDNLDDGQQGRTPCLLSVPCGNGAIQTDMHPDFRCWHKADIPTRSTNFRFRG